ncbi:DUF7822 domain-containing protein [Nannocystis radixulma]|uniref:DUF7822 domain-containing protein n=1 Tax=Nannocystis radixulma TaxID=2995305 RepID=A0ABT5BF44_9BACT|nr:hypothetical protein [Nannocystis radixulma]MDC0672333.1 hypothetical protein [Nannocystis radixulma]
MANRSHLYTCDDIPPKDGFYARGLSEYNWDIPLVHKVMMVNAPRVVRSAIWTKDIGVLAERAGAFERTLAFFARIGEGELPARDRFDAEFTAMRTFLDTTPPTKYLLLEAGEIFSLMGGDLVERARQFVGELAALAPWIERAIAGGAEPWLAQLRADWQKSARPGWWSEVLYFSFEPPEAADEST